MPIAVFAPELAAALLAGSQIINGINSLTDAINEKHNVLDTDGIPDLNVFMNDTAGPCGVPRYNFDLCHSELQGITVTASKPVTGQGQFDNLPPACMVLASALSGDCSEEGPRPTACGVACMLYTGLREDDYAQISEALGI